jgi:hypothetical protein
MKDRQQTINEIANSLVRREINEVVAKTASELLLEMAGSDRRELRSRMLILLQHLIKWKSQPKLQCPSWDNSIIEQRSAIKEMLKESPSLKNLIPERITDWWDVSKKLAFNEMKVNKFEPIDAFCPWTVKQILDETFYP